MSDELCGELARAAADVIWRIHGPESTDRESAKQDGDDIADALLPIIELLDARRRAEQAEAAVARVRELTDDIDLGDAVYTTVTVAAIRRALDGEGAS